MENVYPYLSAVLGLCLMLGLWLAVQLAWGRTFATQGADVLALRAGCGACKAADLCRSKENATGKPCPDSSGTHTIKAGTL
jgi:hypothetical protein